MFFIDFIDIRMLYRVIDLSLLLEEYALDEVARQVTVQGLEEGQEFDGPPSTHVACVLESSPSCQHIARVYLPEEDLDVIQVV